MMIHPLGDVFVVGDSQQSIYGFRGARPSAFAEIAGEATVVVLTQNYRSTQEADAVIATDQRQVAVRGTGIAPMVLRPTSVTIEGYLIRVSFISCLLSIYSLGWSS